MQSNNPVFNRAEGFNGRGTATTTDPSQWTINLNGDDVTTTGTGLTTDRRMTIDSVVEKTALTLGTVIVAAAVTWFLIGDLNAVNPNEADSAAKLAFGLASIGAIAGMVLGLVNSFKKVVSPALVLAYAVVEGVFVGALSKVVANLSFVQDPAIVFQAVLGTMVAFGGTLAAYRFFNIQVNDRFRKVMSIAAVSILAVLVINLVLSLTGVFDNGGLRGFNTLGLIVSIALVVFGVLCLVMDFDFVERGVEAGLPERESWRAAFGLTVTLVWLYIEILRILAILRGD